MRGALLKATWILSFSLVCGCQAASEGSGSSGGDGIRGVFLNAKDFAVDSTLKSSAETRLKLTTELVSDWVEENREDLALDVQLSKHIWIEQEQATCAVTDRSPRADITLSIPSCRDDIKDRERAAFLLVHESVHHFGIDDEYFADQVARSIINVSRTGSVAENHVVLSDPAPARDIEFNNRTATKLDPHHVCHYQGLDHDVHWVYRPDVSIEYFNGDTWIRKSDGIRVQTIGNAKFKILTNDILIQTNFIYIEDCPVIDIRLKLR
jgi:hypothetical protein